MPFIRIIAASNFYKACLRPKNQKSKIRRYIIVLQKKQKEWALDQAIEITKEFARGGSGSPPDYLMSNAYRSILGIIVEINKSED